MLLGPILNNSWILGWLRLPIELGFRALSRTFLFFVRDILREFVSASDLDRSLQDLAHDLAIAMADFSAVNGGLPLGI